MHSTWDLWSQVLKGRHLAVGISASPALPAYPIARGSVFMLVGLSSHPKQTAKETETGTEFYRIPIPASNIQP